MYAQREFAYTQSNISHFAIYHAEDNNAVVHLSTIDLPQQDTFNFVAGITEQNEQLNISLDKMIHGLIAGTTGSGKSVFIKDLLYTLCVSNSPDKVQFAIVDKKRTLNFFSRIGHCLKVGNTDTEAVYILKRFQDEMYRRYAELQKLGLEKNQGQFPKWVLIIDELADLMLTNLKEDIEKNKFNPINYLYNKENKSYEELMGEIKPRIEFTILNCGYSCKNALDKLPLNRNRVILENIISLGMMDKYEKVVNKCDCKERKNSH
jgi:hypothetical protein